MKRNEINDFSQLGKSTKKLGSLIGKQTIQNSLNSMRQKYIAEIESLDTFEISEQQFGFKSELPLTSFLEEFIK